MTVVESRDVELVALSVACAALSVSRPEDVKQAQPWVREATDAVSSDMKTEGIGARPDRVPRGTERTAPPKT